MSRRTLSAIVAYQVPSALLLAMAVCTNSSAAEPPSGQLSRSARVGKPGVFPDEALKVAGKQRKFRLVVPKTVNLAKPAPLVIAYHGILIDSKDFMPKYTKLDRLAADKKFILVFPDAIDRSWGIAPEKVTADLALFDALLVQVGRRYKVDNKRIYVLGMSNGGYFAHLVGKERSKQVAAVCSHSGPLGLQTLFGINARRKFPVMIVHGDKDSIFPIGIARENRDKYRREKHPVNYVEVPGLNHVWAEKANINEQIWKFFAANPLKK